MAVRESKKRRMRYGVLARSEGMWSGEKTYHDGSESFVLRLVEKRLACSREFEKTTGAGPWSDAEQR